MTKSFKGTLIFNSPINKETSFGSTNLSEDVESVIEVTINETGDCYFEW